jgi:hypothetical protein
VADNRNVLDFKSSRNMLDLKKIHPELSLKLLSPKYLENVSKMKELSTAQSSNRRLASSKFDN